VQGGYSTGREKACLRPIPKPHNLRTGPVRAQAIDKQYIPQVPQYRATDFDQDAGTLKDRAATLSHPMPVSFAW
jgi:hypothetical protein